LTKGVHCKKTWCDANPKDIQCVEPQIDKCNKNAKDCTWKLCQEGDNLTKGTHCKKTWCDANPKDTQCIEPLIDKCNADAKDCTWDLCH